jgi:hypothetical protein
MCEGDCDLDSHCAGELKCYHREGHNSLSQNIPPGCSGNAHGLNYDYCYDPALECNNVHVNYYKVPSDYDLSKSYLDSLVPFRKEYVPDIYADFYVGYVGGSKEYNVSARYESYLVFPSTGSFELCVRTDDHGRLYIDGTLFMENYWSQNNPSCATFTEVSLGTKHEFQLDFTDWGGGALVYFTWKVPNASSHVKVPSSAFLKSI